MEVSFSSSFKRVFKKRIKGNPDLEASFWQKLEQFTLAPRIESCMLKKWQELAIILR